MLEQDLKQAVLHYLGDRAGKTEVRVLESGLAAAAERRREFERRRLEITEEIRNGTRRSSGKLPV
jgi:hypothetical protein